MTKIILIITLALMTATFAADKKQLTASNLPAAVKAAFEKSHSKAEITEVDTEVENGVTYWEIGSKDGATVQDLLYAADGTLIATETEIPATDLPAGLTILFTRAYPYDRIEKAEIIVKGGVSSYELRSRTPDDKRHEFLITADGKITELEEEDDGDEDDC